MNLPLVSQKLDPSWIDACVGEPYVIRKSFIEAFSLQEDFKHLNIGALNFDYPNPKGYAPLVELLEAKHKAPVVITNGAKQGLMATFATLSKQNKRRVGMRLPFWALINSVCQSFNLSCSFENTLEDIDSYLLIAPNNPDGHFLSLSEMESFSKECQKRNVTLIHDAAYYSHIYLPQSYPLNAIGDVQLFSFSKLIGFPGLRVGYAVCHNKDFLNPLIDYMEQDTVGVSVVSQSLLFELLNNRVRGYPSLWQRFEALSVEALDKNRELCKQINPELLEFPDKMESGMFGWARLKKANFDAAKVKIAPGSMFGQSDYVRINLAIENEKMLDLVERLNKQVH